MPDVYRDRPVCMKSVAQNLLLHLTQPADPRGNKKNGCFDYLCLGTISVRFFANFTCDRYCGTGQISNWK